MSPRVAKCLVSAKDYAEHFENVGANAKILRFPDEPTRMCSYCSIRPAEDDSDFCGPECRIDAEQE